MIYTKGGEGHDNINNKSDYDGDEIGISMILRMVHSNYH
jgi:hypothetical protein